MAVAETEFSETISYYEKSRYSYYDCRASIA